MSNCKYPLCIVVSAKLGSVKWYLVFSPHRFELTGLPSPAMVEGTAIKTTDNTAYEVMKQGVGEPENGYEMVDTSPPGGPPPADEGEKYDVPASPYCREPLPATPTVGGAEEPNSPPPVTGGGEEEDGVYEIIPGDK